MSDATDWTGVTAGQARIVAQVAGYVPGTSAPIPLNLNATDRSLIVLCNPLFNNDRLNVVGGTTGVNYTPAGLDSPPGSWGWSSPAYGVADPACSLAITGNVNGRAVTVIAVPDELATGMPTAPESVRLVDLAGSLYGTAANPLQVASDGTTLAHTVAVQTISNVGSAVLVAPPAAGHALEVVHLAGHPNFVAAPAVSVSNWSIIMTGSGAKLLQRIAQTGQLDLDAEWSGRMLLTDGLTASATVPAGDVMQYTAVYRTLPIP